MGKGEFEKQMMKIIAELTSEYKLKGMLLGDAFAFSQGVGAGLGRFSNYLNEARKEFPIKQFKYEEPSGLPLQQYKARYEKLAHEMLEALQWFEKWLGSS